MSDKFRAENSHLIDHEQVNKTTTFWADSVKEAVQKFRKMRKSDSTIQEGGLFRVRDEKLVDEYIGYI